ncbi:ribonuclease Z [Corynebacterium glaucum]|uniref:MBL fold metallo-hydrolase n=1 Tax=Corynebacterium glaucum TaxID=187491 RepID=UPI0025B3151D|nr:MBL fold metallo-hydrolase [Corynebacterium glaucum]WJZ08454.1 ribonuclease Z [Corynebacterium glaucum]
MKLTILGCSGSLAAPGNPGSSYVVSTAGNPDVVMDFGPGALAAMQRDFDPSAAHVVFSHLHADHCSDVASLLVWRRYHPTAPAAGRNLMYGPSYAPEHFGRMGSDGPDDINDISDTFEFHPWVSGTPVEFEGVIITPFPVVHPAAESHALRVDDKATGKVITYTGDSGFTPSLIDASLNADLLFCESAWGPTSEGQPEGMHLSGQDAGRIAREAGVKTLVLVHIQPWSDKEAARAAAQAEFDGEVIVGEAGAVFEV